eukprot:scaffold8026_cov444-Prasinococcus_capsulatus_cf.AAC.6
MFEKVWILGTLHHTDLVNEACANRARKRRLAPLVAKHLVGQIPKISAVSYGNSPRLSVFQSGAEVWSEYVSLSVEDGSVTPTVRTQPLDNEGIPVCLWMLAKAVIASAYETRSDKKDNELQQEAMAAATMFR